MPAAPRNALDPRVIRAVLLALVERSRTTAEIVACIPNVDRKDVQRALVMLGEAGCLSVNDTDIHASRLVLQRIRDCQHLDEVRQPSPAVYSLSVDGRIAATHGTTPG